jgi:hypothetical protein
MPWVQPFSNSLVMIRSMGVGDRWGSLRANLREPNLDTTLRSENVWRLFMDYVSFAICFTGNVLK